MAIPSEYSEGYKQRDDDALRDRQFRVPEIAVSGNTAIGLAPATPPLAISRACSDLEEAWESIRGTVQLFETQLAPVLGPRLPEKGEVTGSYVAGGEVADEYVPKAMSPLAESLRNYAQRIALLDRQLQELYGRIEL